MTPIHPVSFPVSRARACALVPRALPRNLRSPAPQPVAGHVSRLADCGYGGTAAVCNVEHRFMIAS